MSCCGDCLRLYKARRYGKMSMYIGNVYCSKCSRFIKRTGMRKGQNCWRCRCCGYPVRHTPYSGRKSLVLNKVTIVGEIPTWSVD